MLPRSTVECLCIDLNAIAVCRSGSRAEMLGQPLNGRRHVGAPQSPTGHRSGGRRRSLSICTGLTTREAALLAVILLLSGIVCVTTFVKPTGGDLPVTGHAALASARRISSAVHSRRLGMSTDLHGDSVQQSDDARATAGGAQQTARAQNKHVADGNVDGRTTPGSDETREDAAVAAQATTSGSGRSGSGSGASGAQALVDAADEFMYTGGTKPTGKPDVDDDAREDVHLGMPHDYEYGWSREDHVGTKAEAADSTDGATRDGHDATTDEAGDRAHEQGTGDNGDSQQTRAVKAPQLPDAQRAHESDDTAHAGNPDAQGAQRDPDSAGQRGGANGEAGDEQREHPNGGSPRVPLSKHAQRAQPQIAGVGGDAGGAGTGAGDGAVQFTRVRQEDATEHTDQRDSDGGDEAAGTGDDANVSPPPRRANSTGESNRPHWGEETEATTGRANFTDHASAEREPERAEQDAKEQEEAALEAARRAEEDREIAKDNKAKWRHQKPFVEDLLTNGLPSLRADATERGKPALKLHPVRRAYNTTSTEFERRCVCADKQSVTALCSPRSTPSTCKPVYDTCCIAKPATAESCACICPP